MLCVYFLSEMCMTVKKQMAPLIPLMGMWLLRLLGFYSCADIFNKFSLRGKEVKSPYIDSLKVTRNNKDY